MAASTTRTVKAKFDGDAKGMIAAAKEGEHAIDKFGKEVDRKMKKHGESSGKGFVNGLKKWFSPGALGDLRKSGEFGASTFGSGFLGALKTPVLGPAIVGILAAAVAVALPAVGAVAASGLVAGFGAGLAGLGLVFAAKSEAVRKVWHDTLGRMGADMRTLSKPFEGSLIAIAGFAERTFGRFKPALASAFRDLAPVVTGLADQIAQGFEGLEPAIRPMVSAFREVAKTLGPAVSDAIRSTSEGLQDLARSVEKSPAGLADLVRGLGDIVKQSLDFVATLNDVNGKFRDLTGGVSLVTVVMKGLQFTLAPLQAIFVATSKGLDLLNSAMHSSEASGKSMSDAANAVVLNAQALQKQSGAADQSAASTGKAGAAAESAATKYNRQKAATDALISSLFRLQGIQLGLSGAQIAYQQSIDDATASLKENGKTLDINTQKGRNNKSALDQVAESANRQTQAMIESGQGMAKAGQSATSSRANFVRLATQFGLSKKAAEAMAAKMIAIPNVSRTAKLQGNIADLEAKLRTAKAQLKTVPASKKSALLANIANLEAGIANAKAALAGLPSSKTVTIKTIRQTVETTIRPDVGVRAPGRASGGLTQPGRTYLVGERGPELWSESRGGRVMNAEQTAAALSGQGSAPMVAEIHIEIGGEVVRVVKQEIRTDKRETKRAVKAR